MHRPSEALPYVCLHCRESFASIASPARGYGGLGVFVAGFAFGAITVALFSPRGAPESADEAPAVPAIAELPPPVAEAPPPTTPRAEWIPHAQATSGDATWFFGEVANPSDANLGNVKVNVVFLDEGGAEQGLDFGFSWRDCLRPGERSPAALLAKPTPPHASVRFEPVPTGAISCDQDVAGLRVEPLPLRVDHGTWTLTGAVVHDGRVPARFVEVAAIGLDGDDRIVAMSTTYADAETLLPGTRARFSITIVTVAAPPVRWRYEAQGTELR